MKARILTLLASITSIDIATLLAVLPDAQSAINDPVDAGLVRRVGVTLSLVRRMIAAAAEACRDLAEYLEHKGAASNHFLRHVAGCLRMVGDHPMRYDPRDGGAVDRIAEMVGIILRGEAKALALLLFAHDLEIPW